MAYQSLTTGKQEEKATNMAVDPHYFRLKSNLDTPMNQTIVSPNDYQDVVFSNVDLLVGGDITYDGNVVRNSGNETVLMTLNLSCSVTSNQPNTLIHIGQAQDDGDGEVIDTGAESSAKCETNTGEQSLNIATDFTLLPNSTLNLKIKADKVATIGMNHFQAVLKQAKVGTEN